MAAGPGSPAAGSEVSPEDGHPPLPRLSTRISTSSWSLLGAVPLVRPALRCRPRPHEHLGFQDDLLPSVFGALPVNPQEQASSCVAQGKYRQRPWVWECSGPKSPSLPPGGALGPQPRARPQRGSRSFHQVSPAWARPGRARGRRRATAFCGSDSASCRSGPRSHLASSLGCAAAGHAPRWGTHMPRSQTTPPRTLPSLLQGEAAADAQLPVECPGRLQPLSLLRMAPCGRAALAPAGLWSSPCRSREPVRPR